MRVDRLVLAGALAALSAGCAVRGMPVSPLGRTATLIGDRVQVKGELMALTPDTIWLRSDSTLRPYAGAEYRQVQVQRHTFGLRRTLNWLGWAGAGTGAALMIACNSYESSPDGGGDSGTCIGVLPGTVLVFAAAGLIFGSLNEYTSRHRMQPGDTERLRPFTRYPQGLPDSLRFLRVVPPPLPRP